jgi:hypothetical protein
MTDQVNDVTDTGEGDTSNTVTPPEAKAITEADI